HQRPVQPRPARARRQYQGGGDGPAAGRRAAGARLRQPAAGVRAAPAQGDRLGIENYKDLNRGYLMAYIGIDFGTSNSVVANFQFGQAEVVPNHEGQKWTPSIVTMRRDGSLAFGQEAKENYDEQRSIRSIKRILGTPERVPLVGQNLRTEQIAVMLFS